MSEIQYILSKAINDQRILHFNNLKNYIRKDILSPIGIRDIYARALENARKGVEKTEVMVLGRLFLEKGGLKLEGWTFDTIEEMQLKVVSILELVNKEWTKLYPGTIFEMGKPSRGEAILIVLKVLPLTAPSSSQPLTAPNE